MNDLNACDARPDRLQVVPDSTESRVLDVSLLPFAARPMAHPCLSCGACCAAFRVSLHWSEAEPALGGRVPIELTEPVRTHELAMRGTSRARPRCVALDADIGRASRCTIHAHRPSACAAVAASWENGEASVQCDRARSVHGLPLLTPADWLGVDEVERDPLPA